tara:strand:+ start:189 stop:464 length:276 start_codon:yes stop_codon:yes gene_type:complete
MLKKPKKNGYYRLINQRTGKIKILKHYQNGIVHGKMIYYWDSGQIRLTGQYEKMQRTGTWKTYGPNGDLILEENFNRQGLEEIKQLALLPI